jgi:hypothetical protein
VKSFVLLALILAGCSHRSDPQPEPRPPVVESAHVAPVVVEPDRASPVDMRDLAGNYRRRNGLLAGRIDSTQNYWDANGGFVGRRNDNGDFFDRKGAYAGRIDVSGNVYDSRGKQTGTVGGDCDELCRQNAVAEILLAD